MEFLSVFLWQAKFLSVDSQPGRSQQTLFTTLVKRSMPLNTLNVCHKVPEAVCCRSALVVSDWAPQEPAAEGANRVELWGEVLHDSTRLRVCYISHIQTKLIQHPNKVFSLLLELKKSPPMITLFNKFDFIHACLMKKVHNYSQNMLTVTICLKKKKRKMRKREREKKKTNRSISHRQDAEDQLQKNSRVL